MMDFSPANAASLTGESLPVDFGVVCDKCSTGILRPARIRTAFWHGDSLIVVQNIPAMVCPDCGEEYVADPTVVQLDRMRGNGFGSLEAVEQMTVPVFDFGGAG